MTPEEELRKRLQERDFDVSFLVEAGAGAGKSHTICQRILHQLASGAARAEELVAITFTEKATQELKEKLAGQAAAFDRENGTQLTAQVGQIHISTIHSFCQTILSLFPLESGCGLDFRVLTAEEDARLQRDFFRGWAREDPGGRIAAYEGFGGLRSDLADLFGRLLSDSQSRPDFAPPGSPDLLARQTRLGQLLALCHDRLHAALAPHPADAEDLMPPGLARAVLAPAPAPEQLQVLKLALLKALDAGKAKKRAPLEQLKALLLTGAPRVEELLEILELCGQLDFAYAKPTSKKRGDPAALAARLTQLVPALPKTGDRVDTGAVRAGLPKGLTALAACLAGLQQLTLQSGEAADGVLDDLHKSLGYDLAMAAAVPAADAFAAQRRHAGAYSFNDLLLRSRDLVRDAPAARAALRRRYRAFYVDEFQDTDPVQAELFFLLTHGEDTLPADWRDCRPTPGSLFLVGDPKQAIYRFRGADLGTYKAVKDLFTRHGVGEVVRLLTNFRSNAEICSYVDAAFAPRNPVTGELLPDEIQALNCDNEAVSPYLDNGLYQAGYAPMDARQGAAGRPMVFAYPNFGEKGEEMEGEDAAKLARFIRNAVAGGYPLRGRDGKPEPIRCRDFLILTHTKAAATRYLRALSALGVPVSFAGEQPLAQVPQIARLAAHLRWLLNADDEIALTELLLSCYGLAAPGDLLPLKKAAPCPLPRLITLREAREALAGQGFDGLLAVFGRLSELLRASRTLPPAALLDRLAQDLSGLARPGDAADGRERERQYSAMRQFLLLAAQCPQPGSFPAVAGYALSLSERSLERELPLVPEADQVRVMNLHKSKGLEGKIVILALDKPHKSPTDRARRTENGVQLASYLIQRAAGGFKYSVFAPASWQERSRPELAHLAAEQVRLKYVAATRAEQLLLIASGGVSTLTQEGEAGAVTVHLPMPNDRTSFWADMAACARDVPQGGAPFWGDLFKPLSEDARAAGAPTAPPPAAAAPGVPDCSGDLPRRLAGQSALSERHISPSALDKSHRRAADPEEPQTDRAPDTEESPEPSAPAAPAASPRGADWGTMVHRLMELCVNTRPADRPAARPLALQAVRETLPDGPLSDKQVRELFGGSAPASYDRGVEVLADAALEATRFWFDPQHRLRRFAALGDCHAELPFRLRLRPGGDELYDFVRERLPGSQGADFSGGLSVSGIMDLAIHKDGNWAIVDYKTDHLRPGESQTAYRARLTAEYSAQLNTYIKVLCRLTGHTKVNAWICAIPLNGELIPIPYGS